MFEWFGKRTFWFFLVLNGSLLCEMKRLIYFFTFFQLNNKRLMKERRVLFAGWGHRQITAAGRSLISFERKKESEWSTQPNNTNGVDWVVFMAGYGRSPSAQLDFSSPIQQLPPLRHLCLLSWIEREDEPRHHQLIN